MTKKSWEYTFVGFTLFSLGFAAIAYWIQFEVIGSFDNDPHYVYFNLVRLIRMILCYVIPVYAYLRYTNQDFSVLGLNLYNKRHLLGVFLGVVLYLVATYVFITNEIFTRFWRFTPIPSVWINVLTIGLMAAITDFWTRGYILLQVDKQYGEIPAIIAQNVVWYVIHIYEIILLVPYIGWIGANLLTLFLGISGDYVALRTRTIYGLMLGHFILNLMIIFVGRGLLLF